jgi:dolichol-phosphate mannosyltransferase
MLTSRNAARGGLEAAPAAGAHVSLSIIVPSRNEEDCIAPLVRALEPAVVGARAEVIFVDDSDDDTPSRVSEQSRLSRLPVHLLHREQHERQGGLGGAVAAGIMRARGEWVCVMDADLQHPPDAVPRLLDEATSRGRDLVVATRSRDGGSHRGFGMLRTLVSRGSAAAARILFPRKLRGISDPMSGFFLVRRSAIDVPRLKPNGFKILLEIVARASLTSVGEVPYAFGERCAGDSKASLREGFRFLVHLVRLRLPERVGRLARFGLIGASGLVVNESLLAVLTERGRLYYLAAAVISTQVSILWNFMLTERWVYARRRCRFDWKARIGAFCLVCTTAQVLTTPLLYLLVDTAGLPYLIGNLIAIAASTLVRFTIADSVIWKHDGVAPAQVPTR